MELSGCLGYWRDPPVGNRHKRYIGRGGWEGIVRWIEEGEEEGVRILEVGSSVGVVMNELWRRGYYNLVGVEINWRAVEEMGRLYPEVARGADVRVGAIEDLIDEVGEFDVIYSKAVFCHLHTDSEWVFGEMAGRSRKIMTVEDEKTEKTGRHFARNYRRVFEAYGFVQVGHIQRPRGMNAAYVGRMMERRG